MDFDSPGIIIFSLIAVVFFYMLYQFSTKGFKGAVLGGRIVKTIGEVQKTHSFATETLRIHVVDRNGEKCVGIELSHFAYLSYSMTGLSISRSDARRLADMIQAAAE
jgi:hypothetical protein